MLVNVYREKPQAIPGTRLLEATLGIVGVRLPDPNDLTRCWEVQGVYLPVPGRTLGGIRAKLTDQKDFVTFINQRDLEVMLGMAKPGGWCPWNGQSYVGPDYDEWFGFCADEDDLVDDLYDREMMLRAQVDYGALTADHQIERKVHLGKGNDVEELYVCIYDERWMPPDPNFETIDRRWVRAERRRVRWEQI